jgi:hypothetical protein
MIYDLIGVIHKPSGVMLTDTEGNEYAEMVAIEGYHVNVLPSDDMSLVEPYIIVPNILGRIFAGREDTVALKFTNRDEWLALGIEVIEEAL